MKLLLTAATLASMACPLWAADFTADPALVEQGRAVATAGDCAACHTNPQSGDDYSGGFAVDSPMGAIYGANITPSHQGIGDWSFAEFDRAMRKGIAPGMHYLYPAMPYTAYAGMSDADMKALYSYLKLDVAPSENVPPKTDLGYPFNIRPVMAGWDLLNGGGGRVEGADAPAGSVARGEYLVKTLTHCSTCHTPRDVTMGEDTSAFLGGG